MTIRHDHWRAITRGGPAVALAGGAYLLLRGRGVPESAVLTGISWVLLIGAACTAVALYVLRRRHKISFSYRIDPNRPLEEQLAAAWNDIPDAQGRLAHIREAEERLMSTPPRCVEGFDLRPSPLKDRVLGGHGESIVKVYELQCRGCGGERFRVLGHHLTNDSGTPIFVSPLALECFTCGKLAELFDSNQHGYNAELSYGSSNIRGTGA